MEQAGPSSATVLEKPLMTPKQVPKASVVQTSPSAPREPGTGLQKEVQTVARSLHRRHEHGGDKYKNWDLTPIRPILIFGSSNLSRVPSIANDRVEVDSYPVANLAQAYHIIKHKTPVSLGTQHVILSSGLNNREQGNPTILGKSVEQLQGAARQTFPNTVIHFPLINYDKTLPGKVVENIKTLNNIFEKTGHSIPLLPWEAFKTEMDKIHWTTPTAEAMLKHWLGHLNLLQVGPRGRALS